MDDRRRFTAARSIVRAPCGFRVAFHAPWQRRSDALRVQNLPAKAAQSASSYVSGRYATDHLGSVHAIVRNGQVIERNDYYPYGSGKQQTVQLKSLPRQSSSAILAGRRRALCSPSRRRSQGAGPWCPRAGRRD